ncbi:MAG: hypothetical protein M1822_003402 [Bathelium mastoideum]|nr:MAG: hypothetical protein M1822_003402 [Bathelium mastoideum]
MKFSSAVIFLPLLAFTSPAMAMASKGAKALIAFIDDIPDSKLTGWTEGEHTIYKDIDFRLDNQGKTADNKHYNVHVQINNGVTISTLKKNKGQTVSNVLVPISNEGALEWDATKIKTELKDAKKI